MYLSELEILGFKSFAQKTKFKFSEGITSVVGPNGCGKSNVVDAVRWVLGEQKTAVLRSDSMGNVIFNGSKNRKPLGMSEVTLTIENDKNILPSEYSQIAISRRLYRSGESKYLLNGTPCRLKDVTNLFMDTGMGADSYSVIELKMVENLLSGKNEDRRTLLEEAAGITKYKTRRKEAERKLNATLRDLERVGDIVSEVEKNVNSLGRQAAKTRRFNKLSVYIKSLEISRFELLAKDTSEKIEEMSKKISESKKLLEQKENELEKKRSEMSQADALRNQIEADYNDLRIEQNKLSALISEKKKSKAVAEVHLLNNQKTKERSSTEIQNLDNSIKNLQEKLKLNDGNIEDLKTKTNDLKKIKEELLDSQKDIKSSLEKSKNELEDCRRNLGEINSEYQKINFRIEQNEKAKVNLKNKTEKLSQDKKLSKDFTKNISQKKDDLNISQNKYLKNSEELTKKIQNQREKKEILGENINAISHQIQNLELEKKSTQNKLDFLEGLLDTDRELKYLIENGWRGEKENGKNIFTLADSVSSDEKYLGAISTLFAYLGKFIIVKDLDELKSAENILVQKNRGKEFFIVPELANKNERNYGINKYEKIKDKKIISWAIDSVKYEKEISVTLENYLNGIAICENSGDGFELLDEGKCEAFVTLGGDFYNRKGIVISGGLEKIKQENFGKIKKINDLNNILKILDSKINLEKIKLSEKQNAYSKINVSELEKELLKNKNLFEKIKSEINSLELSARGEDEKNKLINQQISEIENEEIEIQKNIRSSKENLEIINNKKEKAKSSLEEKNNLFDKISAGFEEQNKISRASELDYIRSEHELKSAVSESQSVVRALNSSRNRIDDNEKLLELAISEIKNLNESIDGEKKSIKKAESEFEELKFSTEKFNRDLDDVKSRVTTLQKENLELINSLEKIRSNQHTWEVENAGLSSMFEFEKKNIVEKYGDSKAETLAEDLNLEQMTEEIGVVKNKLLALGQVNYLALDEYETENKRLIFYTEQINDLGESREILLRTISEINETASKQFVDTFEKIRINFKDLFKTLFSKDGQCDIKLSGDDMLESDISITAMPPGKRPRSIDLLSGGEKTLTAIALLFAIYLVKPSPFCILDEVDAPLDDANIDRYISLIKRFSNNTQFLIVTHNKKTMEAADNLYGITQQEEGVSKVVSVQLNKQIIKD
jgi:chromosome segregation protein